MKLNQCSCRNKPESNCLLAMPMEKILPVIYKYHLNAKSMSQYEKRLFISGIIFANIRTGSGQLNRPVYKLKTHKVCRSGFLFALNCGENQIKEISKDISDGNYDLLKKPKWASNRIRSGEKMELIKLYLDRVGEQIGYPCPSAVRNRKKELEKPIQIWKTKCKHIKIMQKGSDYCDYCTKHLADAKNDDGLKALVDDHRAKANRERKNYLSQLNDPEVPHYTFDFAQHTHNKHCEAFSV